MVIKGYVYPEEELFIVKLMQTAQKIDFATSSSEHVLNFQHVNQMVTARTTITVITTIDVALLVMRNQTVGLTKNVPEKIGVSLYNVVILVSNLL